MVLGLQYYGDKTFVTFICLTKWFWTQTWENINRMSMQNIIWLQRNVLTLQPPANAIRRSTANIATMTQERATVPVGL